ncbi:MAG TPA: PQQ-binding-like beta-propeller repeat protein, partial [Planctomycetota bacterium]|nr:PQQ-binding-like beta-propeller repeat protein [Planctomycetota bacterium]
GHVGDTNFSEALRLIEELSARVPLFVHNVSSEKVLHFSEELVLCLKVPSPQGDLEEKPGVIGLLARAYRERSKADGIASEDGLTGGAAPATSVDEYISMAREFLQVEFLEITNWHGALYELREGPIAPVLAANDRAIKIRLSPAGIFKGFKIRMAAARMKEEKAPTAPPAASEQAQRIEELLRLLPGSYSKHMILRELARLWTALGSPRRAAAALCDVARHYVEWGAEENGCDILGKALELCPLDTAAAEELIHLHQSAGRQRQAELVAQAMCLKLDRFKLHDLIVHFYRLLERAPESPSFRYLGAEALIRGGDSVQGLKEMAVAGAGLESKGDLETAARAYQWITDLDPANEYAREKVKKLGGKRAALSKLGPYRTSIAAMVLLGAWVAWEISSGIAFGSIKRKGESLTPRESVDLVRESSSRFPLSRYARNLASLEEDLYRQSFDEGESMIGQALMAFDASDLETADRLFTRVSKETLITPLAERAEKGRTMIARKRARSDQLLEKAARLVQSQDFVAAFKAYREILVESTDAMLASSYSVPVFVESVPPGAAITVDGKALGAAPRWIFVPSDSRTRLELSRPGFQLYTVQDPLLARFEAKDPRLRAVLLPVTVVTAPAAGGTLATGVPSDPQILVVLGADGVLRGLNSRSLRVLWETPLEAGVSISGPPRLAGPAVLLGTDRGAVLGVSITSGKQVWSARIARGPGEVLLGDLHAGDVLASASGRVVLLNPQTGLVSLELRPEGPELASFLFASRGLGLTGLRTGGLVVTSLRTGKVKYAKEGFLKDSLAAAAGGALLIGRRDGRVFAFTIESDAIRWETRFAQPIKLACVPREGFICLGTSSGSLMCVDTKAGQTAWKTSFDGTLKALDTMEGGGDMIVATLAMGGETVLAAVSARRGKVLWEFHAGPEESASVRMDERFVTVSTPERGVVLLRRPDAAK